MQQDIVVDRHLIKEKKDQEEEILNKVRHLNNFVFAVPNKEHKRVMAKWSKLCTLEREFEKIDEKWANQQFYIYKGFKFPEN